MGLPILPFLIKEASFAENTNLPEVISTVTEGFDKRLEKRAGIHMMNGQVGMRGENKTRDKGLTAQNTSTQTQFLVASFF